MQRFESPILSAVAYPPHVFFAPWKAAAGNIVVNVVLLLFTGVFTDWPPYVWLGTAFIGHLVLIWLNSKEPHLISLNEARFQKGKKAVARLSAGTRNLVKAEGKKYVP